MSLADILRQGPPQKPSESQQEARNRFWTLIEGARLRRWRKGEAIPSSGRRLLVGLAPSYSMPDLEFAEALRELLRRTRSNTVVEFFDILDVETMADMQSYIPRMGKVYRTPVDGRLECGKLDRKRSGPRWAPCRSKGTAGIGRHRDIPRGWSLRWATAMKRTTFLYLCINAGVLGWCAFKHEQTGGGPPLQPRRRLRVWPPTRHSGWPPGSERAISNSRRPQAPWQKLRGGCCCWA